jgi:serine/threonine protein kinase
MNNLTGERLSNQYVLEELIGSGGMADVYRAWDSLRAINMAIKVLRPDISRNREKLAMFEEEAKILKDFGHPNIARFYAYKKHNGYFYLVLEWIDGQSLEKIIKVRGKPLSLNEVSKILSPISSALHYLHNNGYLHCDIKPGNILTARNGKVYLTDLGVARKSNSKLTAGTPAYMAPEQFQSGNLSPQTDIYALGITVYEMLSGGILPFDGKAAHSRGSTRSERIAYEHIHLPLPSLQQYNRSIPDPVWKVIKKSLSKTPEDRFDSAPSFYNNFEKAKINKYIPEPAPGRNTSNTTQLFNGVNREKHDNPPPSFGRETLEKIDQKFRGQPRLIGCRGDYTNKIIQIQHTQLSLGRKSEMQIRFTNPSVSRIHATLHRTQRGTFLQDNHSSVGTYINNHRIQGTVRLNHGDLFRIGNDDVFEFRER